jgi:hypothetical protein
MKFIIAILASATIYGQYTGGTVLVGGTGASTIAVTDSGSVGGTQTVTVLSQVDITANHRFRAWFNINGLNYHDWVTGLTTTNTGTSGCTGVSATWANFGAAVATLTSGAVSGWTITNPGNDFATVPAVTITYAGCATPPAATAVLTTPTTCNAPCSLSINTEYGQVAFWYEVTDSSGNRLSPRQLSSKLFLAFTPQPAATAPFTVPVPVHGFTNYRTGFQFNPGSPNTSTMRAWIYGYNLRDGFATVQLNNNAPHALATYSQIIGYACNGTTCTGTSVTPHGLSVGQTIQQGGFFDVNTNLGAPLNGYYTVATVPTPTTFTVASTIASGDYNNNGVPNDKWVSATTYCVDEVQYLGCMNTAGHYPTRLEIPLAVGEVEANVNNTLWLGFLGDQNATLNGLFHGWYALRFNIIDTSTRVTITQIVVSGTTATATCSSTCPYSSGDTVILENAPGPQWAFNDDRTVLTTPSSTTFTFAWGSYLPGETPGVAPFTLANGTYAVPISTDTQIAPQPVMTAVRAQIPTSSFSYYNPSSNPTYGGNASSGKTWWQTAQLREPNGYYTNNASQGHCSECHTKSGFDLKMFNFPSPVIRVAAMHRGLSESQANDIVAYIQSLSVPISSSVKCRPWNAPYQPAPGLDSVNPDAWTCGGGEEWKLTYDSDMQTYMLPSGSSATWSPNSNLNTRQLPLFIDMPHWNHWLSQTHPADFMQAIGLNFYTLGNLPNALELTTPGGMWPDYQSDLASIVSATLTTTISTGSTSIAVTYGPGSGTIHNGDYIQCMYSGEYMLVTAGGGTSALTVTRAQKGTSAAGCSSGTPIADYTVFTGVGYPGLWNAGEELLTPDNFIYNSATNPYYNLNNGSCPITQCGASWWPAQFPQYEVLKWVVSRKFELMNIGNYQNMYDQTSIAYAQASPNARAFSLFTRGWLTSSLFRTGPHEGLPWDYSYGNQTQYTNRNWGVDTASWYDLTSTLNPGNGFTQSNVNIDWPYYMGFNTNNLAQYRPDFWLGLLGTAIQPQNTWAWPSLTTMQLNVSLPLAYPLGIYNSSLLTSSTQLTAALTAIATQFNQYTSSSVFSTSQWQTQSASLLYFCPLSQAPNPSMAVDGDNCVQDDLAYALAVMNTAGVSGTILSTMATWGNAIFSSSGHNFNTDAAATCIYSGHPARPNCTNF